MNMGEKMDVPSLWFFFGDGEVVDDDVGVLYFSHLYNDSTSHSIYQNKYSCLNN